MDGYFSLDQSVVRELIGRKLVGRTRRDLDDISDCTCVPLASCRRQFDNLCIVLARIEASPTGLYHLVQRKFFLSERLRDFYVGVLFLNHHQIDVYKHASVKALPMEVILGCAHAIIRTWSKDGNSLTFNPAIAHDLRELKMSLWEHQHSWIDAILADPPLFQVVNNRDVAKLVILIKNIFQIGGGLVQSREIRGLLADIVELISIPTFQLMGANYSHVGNILFSLKSLCSLADGITKTNPRIVASFDAFLLGLVECNNMILPTMVPVEQGKK